MCGAVIFTQWGEVEELCGSLSSHSLSTTAAASVAYVHPGENLKATNEGQLRLQRIKTAVSSHVKSRGQLVSTISGDTLLLSAAR